MKKVLFVSILVTSLLFAYHPTKSDYAKSKEEMRSNIKKISGFLLKAKKCFSKVKRKREAKRCLNLAKKEPSDFRNLFYGIIYRNSPEILGISRKKRAKRVLKWTPKENNRILTDISKMVDKSTIVIKCIDSNDNYRDYGLCVENKNSN